MNGQEPMGHLRETTIYLKEVLISNSTKKMTNEHLTHTN